MFVFQFSDAEGPLPASPESLQEVGGGGDWSPVESASDLASPPGLYHSSVDSAIEVRSVFLVFKEVDHCFLGLIHGMFVVHA